MSNCQKCGAERFLLVGIFADCRTAVVCSECAVKSGQFAECEGCKKVVLVKKLCSNEVTGRKECVACYEQWRQSGDR